MTFSRLISHNEITQPAIDPNLFGLAWTSAPSNEPLILVSA